MKDGRDIHKDADCRRGQSAHIHLTLHTEVGQTAAIGQRIAHAGEQQRRDLNKRFGKGVCAAERALDQCAERNDGILAHQQDQQHTEQDGDHDRGHGDETLPQHVIHRCFHFD